MTALETFNASLFLDTLTSLAVALALGTLIGAERQYRQRNAGLRTNALVSVGAAAFVALGAMIAGSSSSVTVLGYVVSGIGFLGAGVIMKEGTNVRGLNTAATIWCSAAVGAFAGANHPAEAAMLAVFVLAGNTFLRPLVNIINRIPIDEHAAEATYQFRVTASKTNRDKVRDLLEDKLEAANYPVRDVKVLERAADEVELVATLAATSVSSNELDAVAEVLEKAAGVAHATWTSTTAD